MSARVVLATDSQAPSGMGEHMLTLGTALAATWDVTLAVPDGDEGQRLLERAAAAGLRIKVLDLGQPRLVRHWFSELGPALLHVHAGIGWEGHDLVRWGKAAGLPVIRTEHLPYLLTSPVQQAAYRAMLLSVDARIAVSEAVHESHRDAGGGKQTVIHNGIAPRAPTKTCAEVREALSLADADPMVLTVARLAPQKGHATLIAAAPQVLARHPRARFALVGDGPDRAALADQIEQAGLEQAIVLMGHREDVPDLLAAADLLVLPSLFEGLSLALLEAMAAGLPVVATPIGGITEALGADHSYLAAPGDSDALAQAILSALSDPAARKASAAAAHQRFAHRFTADRMAAETAQLYQSVLSRQALTPGAQP